MVSRSTRITILLVIDVVFFFIELIAGYAVGSLALVADSFHMLNDVISLIVGLYAIKLSAQTEVDSRYSYGWHRAEILAALINGVFLLALCFTISLEAIERFFSTPNISNPKLIVIVGCFGLASNIVGLFLFHEHGHSHGHSHASAAPLSAPEHTESTQDLRGDVTPTQKVPIRRSRSRSRSRSPSIESYSAIYGHPAATRAALVKTAKDMAARSPSPVGRHSFSLSRPSLEGESHRARTPARSPEASHQEETDGLLTHSGETTPLLDDQHDLPDTHSHAHEHSSEGPSHSHSHGSMNMQGLILHVIGDALGNVGVIAAGLVIWLTEWKYKYSFDPAISLFITIIIFSSALPLVRSASFILLQGVPSNVSLEEVRSSILDVEGVISLHELHVWQLSETKIIASVHVLTSRDHDFMPVAATIRRTLHEHGIHSSTIQPEYLRTLESEEQIKIPAETYCLIACPPNRECDPREHACCPPPAIDV